jgi:hypothetical protein
MSSCGKYLEDFHGTLSKKFGDCGACITEMTVIHLETFKIAFSEIIDSSAVHRLADFIGVFQ